MEKTEELYARLAYEVRMYKNQLNLLQKEIEKLTLTAIDANNAARTIESLEQGDTIIPIGGNAFAKGIISSTNILLGIGSGYLIEVDKETATKKMKQREEATKEAMSKLSQEYSRISAKFEAASRQLQEIEMQLMVKRRGEETTREDYL
ncbi:MAG: prefoldin subunit alpha [Candidatus Bilamarchaeaceae archaeon]